MPRCLSRSTQLTHLQKDLLDLAYTHFNKSKLAGLTARLAHGKLGRETGAPPTNRVGREQLTA